MEFMVRGGGGRVGLRNGKKPKNCSRDYNARVLYTPRIPNSGAPSHTILYITIIAIRLFYITVASRCYLWNRILRRLLLEHNIIMYAEQHIRVYIICDRPNCTESVSIAVYAVLHYYIVLYVYTCARLLLKRLWRRRDLHTFVGRARV